MRTLHLVDPELRESIAAGIPAELTHADLPAFRAMIAQRNAGAPIDYDLPVDVRPHWIDAAADASPVRVVVYSPTRVDGPRPAVLHLHGGGYIGGLPEMREASHRVLAADLGCVIVSVDYRLAPETRHPGPLDDAYTALTWLHDQAQALGVDRGRIALVGESAGGGLAAALALLARDRGEVPLHFQQLIYPMIDDRTCIWNDQHPFTGEFVWTRETNRFGWSALLGVEPGSEGVSPYAAAARAEALEGLPATYISVGALDLFLEENLEYARRLMRAGVPVELHVYPGAYHGFERATEARVSRRSEHDRREALRRALHD